MTLLFFRYCITPTANKLYSLVRKGSMTTPADVLNRFWQDLRDKTRVKIHHPDLPDAMKQVAADAVLSIWQAASEAATGQLATLRAEARHQAHEAEAVRDQVVAELELARQATAATQAELEATRAQLASMRDALATEREAHAATEARLQEIRRQVDEAAPQFAQVKAEFTAEERAVSHEKRALREIDQERTARQKSEKTAEELRVQLGGARAELKDTALQHADALASLRTELRLLQQRDESATQQHLATMDELNSTRSLLQDALQRAERADAEVQVTRRLLDALKRTPSALTVPKPERGITAPAVTSVPGQIPKATFPQTLARKIGSRRGQRMPGGHDKDTQSALHLSLPAHTLPSWRVEHAWMGH
ncbi:DNA-binding protein [Paraburkholderia sp. EG304]|uniref:DNA-binding protein n=1 Tax=Paraburkholderia sp. EG304 TaxID=3237015 RepID=UPI00397B77DE